MQTKDDDFFFPSTCWHVPPELQRGQRHGLTIRARPFLLAGCGGWYGDDLWKWGSMAIFFFCGDRAQGFFYHW
jgi:hypothetical protein